MASSNRIEQDKKQHNSNSTQRRGGEIKIPPNCAQKYKKYRVCAPILCVWLNDAVYLYINWTTWPSGQITIDYGAVWRFDWSIAKHIDNLESGRFP